MIIRLGPEIKDRGARLAKAEGKTTSQIVRELLERYVRERDLRGYIDRVWARVGEKLSRSGKTIKDVDRAITDVRKCRCRYFDIRMLTPRELLEQMEGPDA
jgi:predicted DNA-binding protein